MKTSKYNELSSPCKSACRGNFWRIRTLLDANVADAKNITPETREMLARDRRRASTPTIQKAKGTAASVGGELTLTLLR